MRDGSDQHGLRTTVARFGLARICLCYDLMICLLSSKHYSTSYTQLHARASINRITAMAIIENWLPPSRENWELICRVWAYFPIVSPYALC
jgi:hypothetical protein